MACAIEVQTQRDPALPRRLFDYHYHIERQHRCRVITSVILGDLSQSWRPDRFSSDIPPLGMGLGYVAIKLIDIEKKLEDPKFRGNPVAMVVRAHLAALQTRRDLGPATRNAWPVTGEQTSLAFVLPGNTLVG